MVMHMDWATARQDGPFFSGFRGVSWDRGLDSHSVAISMTGVLARNYIKICVYRYNLEWHFDVGLYAYKIYMAMTRIKALHVVACRCQIFKLLGPSILFTFSE